MRHLGKVLTERLRGFESHIHLQINGELSILGIGSPAKLNDPQGLGFDSLVLLQITKGTHMFLPPYILLVYRVGKDPKVIRFNHLTNAKTYLKSCELVRAVLYNTETGSEHHYDEKGTVTREVFP